MNGTAFFLTAYTLVVLTWVVRCIVVQWVRRRLVFLSPDSPSLADEDCPPVTVIVPARNEEANIADCVLALLAQDYPHLQVIVVDDRSTDDTAAVVRSLVARDRRVRLIRVSHLPDGWTGKTYALQQAQPYASGEWLLFVDADTVLHPMNLRVTLAHAFREQADLVSVLPGQRCVTFWEKVIQPLAGIQLMIYFPLPAVNADAQPMAFANGQYMLFRCEAYDAVGGHAAVRGQLVEDIHLAKLVKGRGLRLRVALTPRLATTRMFDSLAGLIKGWARIFYAAVDGRPGRLAASIFISLVTTFSAFITFPAALATVLAGPPSPVVWTFFALAAAHLALMGLVLPPLYALSGVPRAYVAGIPLASVVLTQILGRAMALCFTHRVEWRGTVYGPQMLREKKAA
jgi:cellulose synthase/poly-beta-1,6-N-acetylglucosamine synthase-like glycosyltransferase